MKRFRDIFLGVLIGCMLMATPVLAESILTKIDVVLNGVNVQLEGENVQVNSILYNGTTYLPMRKVAELVGKDIDWKQETMTANIINKTDVKEGDSVTEQPTEDYKIIKEEDNKILVIQKDGKEYYSWEEVARLIKPNDFYLSILSNDEYALWNKSGTFSSERIKVEKIDYTSYQSEHFISRHYYENTILPLIK